ncbi:hypothetical protein LTR37_005808 [Vermiconidia calcicola]|uniref:Uncharacterized protein n=1 Tax=Vermiconidia calcicola TaxID=1690605 RepID=A0ACC3NJG1_9PEZI|nr:hypothetical protein LTR37_005808 [Vermiconidia calcicola]
MAIPSNIDAHAKPPAAIKEVYKKFQKLDAAKLDEQHPDLLDLSSSSARNDDLVQVSHIRELPCDLRQVFLDFLTSSADHITSREARGNLHGHQQRTTVYEFKILPGLYIYPSLLPPAVQLALLDKLLHRDLSNPQHKTNVHMHYDVPYPASTPVGDGDSSASRSSFFNSAAMDLVFPPKDPNTHKAITTSQFLSKKLRWMTLGGQYDWTAKQYPSTAPPPFPADVKGLIDCLFPFMKAEAAILNLYAPGDTLSLHRDVSEECSAPLVSVSLGCDGVFVCGLEGADGQARVVAMRLKSGDAVVMSGEARYAWHGVPRVVAGTCPEFLGEWPSRGQTDGDVERFAMWKGWMAGKRINLNVRQMFA